MTFIDEPTETELCRAFEDRVKFLEESLVEREGVVLPDMGREPCATHVPIGPHGIACVESYGTRHGPDVGVVGETPAPIDAVVGFSSEFA